MPCRLRPLYLLLLSVCPAPAQTTPSKEQASLRGFSRLFQELAESVDTAVVQIVTSGFAPASDQEGPLQLKTQRGSGSGVIVDADGHIVTNAHVVGLARRVQVLLPQPSDDRTRFRSVLKPSGKLVVAEVLGMDRETDIAVLKVADKGLPFLRFGDSDKLAQGQLVFAFGSPYGLENSVSMGVVSSVARQVRPDDPMIYIQTDAAINPGNSGGPLVDADGAVIGINTFIFSQSGANAGVGFAVPSSIARNAYRQIVQNGRVRRGQIGVVAQTITPQMAQALKLPRDWGVILADVKPQGAADAAGLQLRDIIVSMNGKPMENARQFGVNIYQNAGQTVMIELLRNGQTLQKQVAVLERPQDPDRLISLASSAQNMIPKLGILAVDLDSRVTPLLPTLRRLSGVVVAGNTGNPTDEDPFHAGDVIYEVNNARVANLEELKTAIKDMQHGDPAVVLIERGGQLQYSQVEID